MLNAFFEWRSTLFDSQKSHNKQTNSPKIKTSKPVHMLIGYNLLTSEQGTKTILKAPKTP